MAPNHPLPIRDIALVPCGRDDPLALYICPKEPLNRNDQAQLFVQLAAFVLEGGVTFGVQFEGNAISLRPNKSDGQPTEAAYREVLQQIGINWPDGKDIPIKSGNTNHVLPFTASGQEEELCLRLQPESPWIH